MTSKERITRILSSETPDRVGIKDLFWDQTRAAWERQLGGRGLDAYFDFDIAAFNIDNDPTDSRLKEFFSNDNKDRFLVLSFSDPFQRYCEKAGPLKALEDIGNDPGGVEAAFKEDLDQILSRAIGILDKGYQFDGVWLFGDLAHDKGLFFSPEFYSKHLFGFHKEICYFFASYGIPTILHSDGNIRRLIPQLIMAGFRALHPVAYSAGLDIKELKREYKSAVAFFGNFDMDIFRIPREALTELIPAHLEVCKEGGGYIFGLDSPLSPNTNIDDYKFILDLVKEHGRY